MWDSTTSINVVSDIKTSTTVFFGIGAVDKISQIAAELTKKNITRVIVMSAKGSFYKTDAWDIVRKALEEKNINFVLYSVMTPYPSAWQVDEAAEIALDFGATAVIEISGGSTYDAAKSTAILIANKCKIARDIYEIHFTPEKAVPIIAINLTYGIGTEVNRFAVAGISEK